MKRISAIGLCCLALAGALVAVTSADEPWNGIIKTDMASLLTPRDVSQSKVIPAPEPTFGGFIDKDAYKSKAWWPPAIAPKKGSPNVLLILIDDEGYAANSTFGGLIPTPTSDQLAREGCRRQRDRWTTEHGNSRLRIRSETMISGCIGLKARQTGQLRRLGKLLGLQPALELCGCKPPGVSGNLAQDSKWKCRFSYPAFMV